MSATPAREPENRPLTSSRFRVRLFPCVRTIVLVTENAAAVDMVMGKSSIRRRILALLIAEPDQRLHLREIQRRVGTSPGTASRELALLVAAGLVEREAEGHQVYFRPTSSPFATMVRTLLLVPAVQAPDHAANGVAPVDATPEPARPPRTIRGSAPARTNPRRPDALGLRVLSRLAAGLGPLYAERLAGVFLYGARARGDAQPDADVEIVVVLNTIDRYGDELERTSAAFAGISLELGLIVSRVFVSEAAWQSEIEGRLSVMRSEAMSG